MKTLYTGAVLDINMTSKGVEKTLLTIKTYEGPLKYLTVELLAHNRVNITVESHQGIFTHSRYRLTHYNVGITGYRKRVGDPVTKYRYSMDLAAREATSVVEGEERRITVNVFDDEETGVMTAEVVLIGMD